MEKNGDNQMPFIHPSRAHLFKKPPISDETFKHTSAKNVAQTWNNRLERNKENQTLDQLLVFGYASKLFPPDEHSSAVAKNRHLIPWNDDQQLNLLIDRYDCRASLHNLSEFDGDSWNKSYQLSDEEIKLEKHLDEERYRALFVEELEEDIRHEEELKRLHASIAEDEPGYGQVAYDYNSESAQQYDPTEPTNDEEDQELFIAPTSLAVPSDMEIPATEKMHAIIEKTAVFVSRQGAQMEIVLKAKQANNSQFQFLQFDHYLNPYYKHMVKRIKEGKYSPGAAQEQETEQDEESSDDDGDGSYLHPSLFASSHKKSQPEHEEKTKAIRSIDPDHPLAKLIEKGRQANAIKQYQAMAEAVHSYYKQQGVAFDSTQSNPSTLEPPPLPTFMTMAGLHSTNDHASVPQIHFPNPLTLAPPDEETDQQASLMNIARAQWTADAPIVPPPPDLQEVVEEIAKKVAIEGSETEKALICHADADYSFLNPWHELHPYYQYRKMSWLQILHPPPPPVPDSKQDSSTDADADGDLASEDSKNTNDSKSTPISFSIKARKEGLKKSHKLVQPSVLGEVASDDEEEAETKKLESKKPKGARRRFTDHPPSQLSQLPDEDERKNELETTQSSVSTKEEVALSSASPLASTASKLSASSTITPSTSTIVSSILPPTSALPVSSFTAVTPSGESASISDLREKQAARRRRALLFLQAKSKENKQSKQDQEPAPSNREALAAIASQDIFDLSSVDDESASNDQKTLEAEETAAGKSESPPNLSPSSPAQSSSPRSISSCKLKSFRKSRSRSASPRQFREFAKTSRDSPLSLSKSINDVVSPSRRLSSAGSTSSAADDQVPSAYRVITSKKSSTTKSATTRKRSRKRSRDRDAKRHKRGRSEKTSSHSSKHKRSARRTSRDRRKKKRRKEKKSKKSRRKTSSSSSTDDESGDDVTTTVALEDQEVANIVFEVENERVTSATSRHDDDVISEEASEGEIVSE